MSGKFSDETVVANAVRVHLETVNARVLQLVSPGGQATLSITYSIPEGRKTVFPDVLAIYNHSILVGEIKANFSIADKRKLVALENSDSAREAIRRIVSAILKEPVDQLAIRFALMHSDERATRDEQIEQFCFLPQGLVHLDRNR